MAQRWVYVPRWVSVVSADSLNFTSNTYENEIFVSLKRKRSIKFLEKCFPYMFCECQWEAAGMGEAQSLGILLP